MLPLTTAGAAALLLAALCACSGDDGDRAADPEATTQPDPVATTAPMEPGLYPELVADDYTYVLETICFCPMEGPVRITVDDGKVVSAVYRRSGKPAMEYHRMTINDVIAEANDPKNDSVDVAWPEGQDWPFTVAIDRIKRAVDDEITYVVSRVRITG